MRLYGKVIHFCKDALARNIGFATTGVSAMSVQATANRYKIAYTEVIA